MWVMISQAEGDKRVFIALCMFNHRVTIWVILIQVYGLRDLTRELIHMGDFLSTQSRLVDK
jgi:hypothetical protein